MLNVFVSIRCKGRNYDVMKIEQLRIISDFILQFPKYKEEICLIESLNKDYVPEESNKILYLGKSIEELSKADIILIPMDYVFSKGCRCEKFIAEIYGIPMKSYIHTDNNTYFIDGFIDTLMLGGSNNAE